MVSGAVNMDRVGIEVTLQPRIQEVLRSTLARKTTIPIKLFLGFSQLLQANAGIAPRPLPSKSFLIHDSPLMLLVDAT
jgi:hypothetical protein